MEVAIRVLEHFIIKHFMYFLFCMCSVWYQNCEFLLVSVFQAEQSYRVNPKFLTQIQYCEDNGIPVAVVIGEDELSKNVVKIRNVVTKAEVR